jgi:hypothetical protein
MTRCRLAPAGERLCSESVICIEHVLDVPADHFGGRIAKETFRCRVPRANLSVAGHRIGGIGGLLKQCEQFGFEYPLCASCSRDAGTG